MKNIFVKLFLALVLLSCWAPSAKASACTDTFLASTNRYDSVGIRNALAQTNRTVCLVDDSNTGFDLTGTFEINSGSRLYGISYIKKGKVPIRLQSSSGSSFSTTIGGIPTNNVEIRNVQFENTISTGYGSSVALQVGEDSSSNDSYGVTVTNTAFVNWNVGVQIETGSSVELEFVLVSNSAFGVYGANYARAINALSLRNSKFSNVASYAIFLARCDWCQIVDNKFETTGFAFRIGSGNYIRYLRNQHTDCNALVTDACILVYITTASLDYINELTIEQNTFNYTGNAKPSSQGIIYANSLNGSYTVFGLAVLRNSATNIGSANLLYFGVASAGQYLTYAFNSVASITNPPTTLRSNFNP